MQLKFIDDIELKGARVIARFDFNVPLEDSSIVDTTRIDNALPTIKHILERGADKLIMMSHLGRPKGQVAPQYSLAPVAAYLAQVLEQEIIISESCTDEGIRSVLNLPKTKIVMLENLRFHSEETANDNNFAQILASYADIYVNDAFGTAHRKHASTHAINGFFKDKAVGGLLLKREISALKKIIDTPAHPFIGIVGGAKVADKIGTLERLLISVDKMLIGGAMAYAFLAAKGHTVGESLYEEEDVQLAGELLKTNSAQKIVLPIDHITSDSVDGEPLECKSADIPSEQMGLDIGVNTQLLFKQQLTNAKTIFWNGPMGYFENPKFSAGTLNIARAIVERHQEAFSLVGGGDSVAALKSYELENKVSHISTGGGASLEYLEKGNLPAIDALKFGVN